MAQIKGVGPTANAGGAGQAANVAGSAPPTVGGMEVGPGQDEINKLLPHPADTGLKVDVPAGAQSTTCGVYFMTPNRLLHNSQDTLITFPDVNTGNLTVAGNHTVNGSVAVSGSQTVKGSVTVTGDIVLANQDCAEDFDLKLSANADPGTVMVLDEAGLLQASQEAYDRKVAGVVTGAGEYKPGITLGRRERSGRAAAIALVGKVFCKVDAKYGAVNVGDLLTTSPTPGCAMKAQDQAKAFGATVGKALRPLSAGQGLIPILVALQ